RAARRGGHGRALWALHCDCVHSLREEHSGKVTFVERLRKAGLLATGIEIPSNSAGERIHGTGTLGPERAQERQTVRREELAGGLDARERTCSLRCTRPLP